MEDQDQDLPPPDAPTANADQNTQLDDETTSVASHDGKLYEQIDRYISESNGDDQPDSPPPHEIVESVHTFADLFDVAIVEFESGSRRWIQLEEDESDSFMQSIDRTAKLLTSFSRFCCEQNCAAAINRLSGVQQRAMSALEVEFKSIVDDYQTSNDQVSSSPSNVQENSETEMETETEKEAESPERSEAQPVRDEFLGYSDEKLSDLNKLANGLIRGGHVTECGELYFFVRRNAIEQNLKILQFEKLSIDEMQKMQWEPIEKEICSWKKMFREFCTSFLPSERRLVDAIFSGQKALSDRLFTNLTRIILSYFLNFAEAVMLTKRSAEKLFKFLDIYETVRDTFPAVEKLISDDWLNELKSTTSLICTTLGESIFTIFIELENSIKSDSTKSPVPGGAVHPLTRYVMNYLKYACEYSDTLEQIFQDHKNSDRSGSGSDSATASDVDDHQNNELQSQNHQITDWSPFQSQLAKIMDLLDANLESKSKLYKDPPLSLIFMMNNGRYILQKTKGTGEMRTLMGDPWVRKRSSDLRSYHTSYKRETWTRLLQCLSHDGLSVNGKVMKPVLKERFKSFNAMFDEIYRTQTTWVVSDEQLQSELRVSISAIVIPAYRSFMGRFSQVFTPGRQTEKYIKYQPEDIETCIEELFDGSTAHHSKKR